MVWLYRVHLKHNFEEKLAQVKVEVPEVTQSEVGQKQKLGVVLDVISKILQIPPGWKPQKWSVESEFLHHFLIPFFGDVTVESSLKSR
jgi:hypothetical protein